MTTNAAKARIATATTAPRARIATATTVSSGRASSRRAWPIRCNSRASRSAARSRCNFVAYAIDQIGIVDCDSTCRALIEGAVDTGLAALGLPPSLPNFDELVQQGEDYLKHELEDYLVQQGVPQALIDNSEEIVVVKRAMDKGPGGISGADWLTLDDGFRAAVLTLTVSNDAAFSGFTPNHLTVTAFPLY